MPYFLLDSCKGMWRHHRLPNAFLLINPYIKMVRSHKWSHSVQLAKAHRMICMMTLKSRDREVKRPDVTWPEVNLWPWLLKVNTYIFRCGLTRELRWYSKFWPSFITSKVIRKKTVIASRAANLAILTPVTPEPTSKMQQMRHRTHVIAESEADSQYNRKSRPQTNTGQIAPHPRPNNPASGAIWPPCRPL